MGLLDDKDFGIPKQICPRCKEPSLIATMYGHVKCTKCPLFLSKGGMIRGFSLHKHYKEHVREVRSLKKKKARWG